MSTFFKHIIVFAIFLFSTSVNAGVFKLTPPAVLNIDGQSITNGDFTLESFRGFNLLLSETTFLSSTVPSDDITQAALIGSPTEHELLSYPGTFPIIKFDYNFDATSPNLPAISSSVLSASTNFIIDLPFSSTISSFFEVVDSSGVASFHTTEATLSLTASGVTNIDLFGDQSVYATFGAQDTLLSSGQFQAHGSVVVLPVPAPVLLMSFGLFGLLLGMRKRIFTLSA